MVGVCVCVGGGLGTRAAGARGAPRWQRAAATSAAAWRARVRLAQPDQLPLNLQRGRGPVSMRPLVACTHLSSVAAAAPAWAWLGRPGGQAPSLPAQPTPPHVCGLCPPAAALGPAWPNRRRTCACSRRSAAASPSRRCTSASAVSSRNSACRSSPSSAAAHGGATQRCRTVEAGAHICGGGGGCGARGPMAVARGGVRTGDVLLARAQRRTCLPQLAPQASRL